MKFGDVYRWDVGGHGEWPITLMFVGDKISVVLDDLDEDKATRWATGFVVNGAIPVDNATVVEEGQ
jgi:hypothetical protein